MRQKLLWIGTGALLACIALGAIGFIIYARQHWFVVLKADNKEAMANICSGYLACAPYPDEPPKICSDMERVYFLDSKTVEALPHCALNWDYAKGKEINTEYCAIEASWDSHRGVSVINLKP